MQSLPPPGSRVAIYSRYSTSRQNQNSIEGQERLCAAYAKERGWVEYDRFSDAERSGTTTHGRTGLIKMLEAAEHGEFDVLLVEDIDRASRDAADMHIIAKQLEDLEIVLCTVSGGVVGEFELAFKSVQNQQFIKQNIAKSKRGQELAISQGRMSGSVAYGYRKVSKFDHRGEPINGLREIDPEEAAIVRRIHMEFDAGRTTFQICQTLNAEGVPSPKGKQWRPGTLLGNRQGGVGILRNPTYNGEFHFRKTSRKLRKGEIKMTFRPEAERMVAHHPELRIIYKDMWERNQARLAEHSDRPFFRKKRNRFAFSGKVHCGECGSTAVVCDGKYVCTGRRDKGICTNTRRVFRSAVEETIFERLKQHILDTTVLGPALDAFREEVEQAQADQALKLKTSKARLQEVDIAIANLTANLSAASETSFASSVLIQELERFGAEKRRLEIQVKQAAPTLAPGDTDEIIASISQTLDHLSASLQSDEPEAARAKELLRELVGEVVLTPIGPQLDGRGAGDVQVTVKGPIASLVNLANLNIYRVTKNGHRPTFELEDVSFVWTFSYVLRWDDPRLNTVRSDLTTIARLLDEADVPVSMNAMAAALAEADDLEGGDQERSPAHRARNATAYLQEQGLTRCINLYSANTGYVWNQRGLTDDQWKARVAEPPVTRAISPIRKSPPECIVVTVERSTPSDPSPQI